MLNFLKKLFEPEPTQANETPAATPEPLPNLLQKIEKITQKKLQAAPERAGDPLAAVRPIKQNTFKYALDSAGNLIGLNLASAELDDQKWLKITQIPEATEHLRILNLSENRLTRFDFPVAGAAFQKLEILDLGDNQIKHFALPTGMEQLRDLELVGNPLDDPGPEQVEKGKSALLRFLKEIKLTGEEKSLEAKIVLVGEGMAGKTSLRVRLLRGTGDAVELPEPDQRTMGLEIEIEQLPLPLPSGEVLRINLFDFGGQKHYKPLHQFFYSHRSLFVLVTKNGDDSNDFDFWFETAQLFGGGSPILVVNNLFGEVAKSGFSRSRFERFDEILKDSTDINLKTCTAADFAKLKKRLTQLADELPHVHQTIPKSYANVRRAVEALRLRNIIPLDEFEKICARPENGGMDTTRAADCLDYLYTIGACLFYKNTDSLCRHVIVRNEWATEAVYRVMEDEAVEKKQHGKFSKSDLRRIWQPRKADLERGERFDYEKYLPELLELMRNFKLCYPLKNERGFVAPSLLPTKKESDAAWLPDDDLQFEVEYDFMPSGLFSRFVVARHEDIAGDDRNLVWRDEVFFEWETARANASTPSRAGKKVIVFRVQGSDIEQRKVYLEMLRKELQSLHDETPGIVVEEKIPCICPLCSTRVDGKEFFKNSVLKTFVSAGDDDIQCQKSRQMVSVKKMLGSIFPRELRHEMEDFPSAERIRQLIAAGKTREALAVFSKLQADDAAVLSGKFEPVRQQFSLGNIDLQEFLKFSAQIHDGILQQLTR